uniref:Secreted protein n=1 Tax=Caenorhabditis tropicalis TaxID=1561998 RepID=A0A1I7U5M7_9PELO
MTRYYACLAVCTIASVKEFEPAVIKSGTLQLVEPFLHAHDPAIFAIEHRKYAQGRPKEWLERLLPMLKSSRREARSVAAFHFTLEATIKKEQNKLDVFQKPAASNSKLTMTDCVIQNHLRHQPPFWPNANYGPDYRLSPFIFYTALPTSSAG